MKRLIAIAATLMCLLMPMTAAAYNPLDSACSATQGRGTPTACGVDATKNPLTGPNGTLKKISLVIATIAGLVAVIIIIVAGLQMITANGDAQKVASARSAVIGSIVGLVIIVAAESIVIFVISKL